MAGGFVCLAFLRCTSPYAALVVLALVLASVSLSIPGCMVAVSDLAPNYTGTIMGIINTVGHAVGFITPLISNSILEGNVGKPLKLTLLWIFGKLFSKLITTL